MYEYILGFWQPMSEQDLAQGITEAYALHIIGMIARNHIRIDIRLAQQDPNFVPVFGPLSMLELDLHRSRRPSTFPVPLYAAPGQTP